MVERRALWWLALGVGVVSCRTYPEPAAKLPAARVATVYVDVGTMRHWSSEMEEILSVNGDRFDASAPRIYQGPGQSPRVLQLPGGEPAAFALGVRYVGPRPRHWSEPLVQHWLSSDDDLRVVGFASAVVDAVASSEVVTACEQIFSFRPAPGASYRVEYRLAPDRACAVRCTSLSGGACDDLSFTKARAMPEPTPPAALTTLAALLTERGVVLDDAAPHGALVVASSDAGQLRAGDELVDLACDDRFGAMRVHRAPSGTTLSERLCQPDGTLVVRLRRGDAVESAVLRAERPAGHRDR
ncbi:hypothetical protein L6R52_38530 [Myxococcota bacterium]|nr:hypothetical protein [Myxococcota bacterium]